jgi:hypothetical protein
LSALGLLACGPQTEPAKSAPPDAVTVTAPPAASSSEPTPAASAEPPSEPAPTASAPAAPPEPSEHELSFAMCDNVKTKCSQSSFESCRVNCSKYESAPDGCDEHVRTALTCAKDAPDLVCANVAPESCAKKFRLISACASGKKTESPVAQESLPPGFAIYQDSQEGFQAPMPQPTSAGGEAVTGTTPLVSARHESGAIYSVRKMPRPTGKLNEKVFLKLGLTLFGRCSDKMKLQGMVDKPGRTSINYTTRCPDGTEEAGMFWATDKTLFIASVKGPAGKLGPADAFIYGFEVK